jgi:hypothetical protein
MFDFSKSDSEVFELFIKNYDIEWMCDKATYYFKYNYNQFQFDIDSNNLYNALINNEHLSGLIELLYRNVGTPE